MCIHEFYSSSACGHNFPKLPPSAKPNKFFKDYQSTIAFPQSLTCAPVKLALKFYHDQVVYLPADMNCGAKVDIPKSCPIIHGNFVKNAISDHEKALEQSMLRNGLGPDQIKQIEKNAGKLDQCSNRAKPGEHNPALLKKHKELPYPPNMYAHVQDVKNFQSRDRKLMVPNVRYIKVDFGCGGPFSADCQIGWDGIGLLMHRLHLWNDETTHPKPCHHKCLAGWSGPHLDRHRRQTWAGTDLKIRGNTQYSKLTPNTVREDAKHWVAMDYSNVAHRHVDQWQRVGNEFERIYALPSGQVVHVPEKVLVPVPAGLDQVLRRMNPMPPPGSPLPNETDQASIEDILGRLPEAFNEQEPLSRQSSRLVDTAQGSESAPTLVDESVQDSESVQDFESTSVEAPEVAEARRRRAREVMREKLRRDFSAGIEKMSDEEG